LIELLPRSRVVSQLIVDEFPNSFFDYTVVWSTVM
jgi:hypothetical protein